ncbi:MobV family relaxase [Pseudomonas sp. YQ_13]|uniref:MobV family relaxase n=1 Tax=Pseudomonas sp. YQ_13 TaxID=3367235 RepID=UPI00370A2F94
MNFAIIRTKKLKSMGAVVRSGKHTFREQLTPNADSAMTPNNRVVGAANSYDLKDRLQQRLPAKIKARSVLCIEYMITASPEAFSRHGGFLDDMGNGYFSDALKWLQQRHGRDNVISSVVHLDETTPHLVAYVAPMTSDNRLSCRDFLGGREKMKKLQSDFYEVCGKERGLQRGIQGSRAKHQDIKKFYTALHTGGEAPKLERRDYAAAAMGIKTARWRKAEAVVRSQAQGAVLAPLMRNALMARGKAIRKRADELNDRLQALEHKHLLLKKAEDEVERRVQALMERERDVKAIEHKLLSAEAERDALERRLEILTQRNSTPQAAPFRGRMYDSESKLTQS